MFSESLAAPTEILDATDCQRNEFPASRFTKPKLYQRNPPCRSRYSPEIDQKEN